MEFEAPANATSASRYSNSFEKDPDGENTMTALELGKVKSAEDSTNTAHSFNDTQVDDLKTARETVDHDVKQDETPDAADAEIEYPKALEAILITIALCFAVFCMALDNTIIATAVPRITVDFKSIDDIGWYGSSYLLTTCSFQLLFGQLYSFYSLKWMFLFAIAIFEIGSAICGAAPTSDALIVGRAIAGIGSAGILSGALLIAANTVPLHKRGPYLGIILAVYGLASVAGPLMGGALTDNLSWRWCFYINLPIGAVTIIFLLFFYRPTKPPRTLESNWRARLNQFDIYGTLVLLPTIICLLLALQWGGTTYAWNDRRIIALFILFGILLLTFIGIQYWKKENATVPFGIVCQQTVAATCCFAFSIGAAFLIGLYYMPIWFQAVKGTSATESGVRSMPTILSLMVMAISSGFAVKACGYYAPFFYACSIVMAIGSGLLSTFQVDTGHAKWIGYQVIFGMGFGLGTQQAMIAVQTVLPPAHLPIGSALVVFSQTLGGTIFISVGQNVFSNHLLQNLASAAPGINAQAILEVGATGLRATVPAEYLRIVLIAYNGAIQHTFYVAAAMSVLSAFGAVFIEWKSVKGKKIDVAPA